MWALMSGLALWSFAHLFKRLLPTQRAALGSMGQLVVTVLLVASIVLMVSGYRSSDSATIWVLNSNYYWAVAPLLSLPFYLFAADICKSKLLLVVPHPQLTAVIIWAVGHLLLNGDVASVVLFGGLLAWAVIQLSLIVRQEAAPDKSRVRNGYSVEAAALALGVVLYLGAGWAHGSLGYPVLAWG
ncbi:MAG: NnrU family protein [Luminiphilus sp.]|nr:NnrU family protein [Luminiphilus sp.]